MPKLKRVSFTVQVGSDVDFWLQSQQNTSKQLRKLIEHQIAVDANTPKITTGKPRQLHVNGPFAGFSDDVLHTNEQSS